jgi:opacity protein-like surface antigen
MKTIIAMCLGVFAWSSTGLAEGIDSKEYNSSLSFLNEERTALVGGGGNSDWYFTPHVGVNLISRTATEGFTIKFGTGISFGGGFGVEIQPDLAFQFDFGYIRNDVDEIVNESTNVTSAPNIEFTQIPLLFNLIWSPTNQPDLQPYFGMGLGAIRGKYDSNAFISSEEGWALALRVRAGVQIDLSTTSNLSIGYQFTLAQYDDNIDNHTIGLGFQFNF